MSSLVFNDIVASFVIFFVYFQSSFSRVPGLSRDLLLPADLERLPTTMCPQNKHNSRLSQPPRFVKEKIRLPASLALTQPIHPRAEVVSNLSFASMRRPSFGRALPNRVFQIQPSTPLNEQMDGFFMAR